MYKGNSRDKHLNRIIPNLVSFFYKIFANSSFVNHFQNCIEKKLKKKDCLRTILQEASTSRESFIITLNSIIDIHSKALQKDSLYRKLNNILSHVNLQYDANDYQIIDLETNKIDDTRKTTCIVSPEINELLNKLDEMDNTNKIKTLKKIGARGPENKEAGSKIISFLLNDPNDKVRLEAAQIIAKLTYPVDKKVLDEVLSDPKNDNIKSDLLVAAQSLYASTEAYGFEKQMQKDESEKYIPTIFLAGVNEDKDKLNDIYEKLTKGNYADVYMFKATKYIGEKFKPANDERIRKRDFFIPCFSTNTQKRLDSLFHREVKIALDTFLSRHPDALYFLPIKLDVCEIPNYVVESERTKDKTYAKYSEEKWIKQIKESIERELKRRRKLEKEPEK